MVVIGGAVTMLLMMVIMMMVIVVTDDGAMYPTTDAANANSTRQGRTAFARWA